MGKIIGKEVERWDARAKVQGKANYTADIPTKKKLYGKICRATIAHGLVKKMDLSEALKIPGVVKILTPDDLPDFKFPTAGHPFSLNPKTRDKYDRNLLTKKVRLYGDEIAAVIAETELAAELAVHKIKVEYEAFPFYLTPEEALADDAVEIHEGTKNIIAATVAEIGDIAKGFEASDHVFEDQFSTQMQQHCHMESQVAYAYQDVDQRWVCVSSTQIPHICRRILGEAFGMPWGQFRVIKPFIGGGFGNKQDVVIEPLVVAMSMAVGGKPVMLELTREESLAYTRVRHAINYNMKLGVSKDGKIKALEVHLLSANGGYASHGHSIAAKGGGMLVALYKIPNMHYDAKTVYTNVATAGAMRGYGVPQIMFAIESFMENVARKLDFDPIEFRLKNLAPTDEMNPINEITPYSGSLKECILKGKEQFHWDEKKEAAAKYKIGAFRRGVGLATFAYTSGTYPKGYEIAGCRLTLNQDGSVKCLVGATEIGQGSDTVFRQMVAEQTGIPYERIFVDAHTDTDYAPFDTGAYASRQTYVTGMAVEKTASELKEKILNSAEKIDGIKAGDLDIIDGDIVLKANGDLVETVAELALKSFYHLEKGECITAEVSNNCRLNSYPFGVTYAEVEIDTITGKVKILSIMNVHDSGKILNPLLASGQVEGGMAMAIPYALSEELKYNAKTGAPLNNNLLDYKMPTAMDVPDLSYCFVETEDCFGPFGSKALGEPPICSPAPALRNAILDAVDEEFNHLPVTPQKIFERMNL